MTSLKMTNRMIIEVNRRITFIIPGSEPSAGSAQIFLNLNKTDVVEMLFLMITGFR